MKNSPLAFDYQSSTPCLPEVVEAMEPYWREFWGNPSSRQNRLGLYSSAAVSVAREQLCSLLNVKSEQLIFTSGATEANNLALLGYARAKSLLKGSPGHLITMTTEHHSVLDPMRQLRKEGFSLTELRPNYEGLILFDDLQEAIKKDTYLVSVMLANNEIGVIQPIKKIGSFCRENDVIFHCDAVQGFGYLPLDLQAINVDLLTISAHKIYGPKGIGALIIPEGISLLPLQWGGGQENGFRPGTLPLPLIVGFAKAAEIANKDIKQRNKKLEFLRNTLKEGLSKEIPNLIINGSMIKRLPHNLNISIMGVNGNNLYRDLRKLIACSSGSACSNGEPSHVLLELGRDPKEAESSLRLSLGIDTTIKEIYEAIKIISSAVKVLQNI